MNRIYGYLKKTFSYVTRLFSTHPVTFAAICMGTVTAFTLSLFITNAVTLKGEGQDRAENVLWQLIAILAVFCLWAFCAESSPLKGRVNKAVLCLIHLAGAPAAVFFGSGISYFMNTEHPEYLLLGNVWEKAGPFLGSYRTFALTAGLCIILYSFGIFFSFLRMENRSFAAYSASIYSRYFFAEITFWILTMGTAALTGIFTALIWGDFEKAYAAVFTLILGGYLVMRCVECLTEETEEPNVFVSILIRYVMLTMCLIAYVIIYIYMLKLVILREFPSNSVFEILTALFVISMPIAYMATDLLRESGGTEGVLRRLALYLPYIFAPFILLQIYTAGVRIAQYGLTPKRYLGILMIIFEVAYILLYFAFYVKHCRRFALVLPVIALCAFISTWMPGINALDLSKSVQLSLIRSYLREAPAAGSSSDDRGAASRAAAAFEYISDDDVRVTPEDHFSAEEIRLLSALTKGTGAGKDSPSQLSHIWYANESSLDIDVSGRKRIRYGCLAAVAGKKGTPEPSDGGDDKSVEDGKEADLIHTGLYVNDDGTLNSYDTAQEIVEKHDCLKRSDLTDFRETHIMTGEGPGRKALNESGFQDLLDRDNMLTLDDGERFCITEALVTYDEDNGRVTELLLKGIYITD